MLPPVKIENHVLTTPSNLKEPPHSEEKINFFQALNPFVQLLLAIGNAILAPSFFFFNHLQKRLTASQKVFFQTVNLPTANPPAEVVVEPAKKEVEHPACSNEQAADLQERLAYLEQRFKEDFLIVENARELEKLNLEVKGWQDQLRQEREQQNPAPDLKDTISLAQKLDDKLDDFCLREGVAILNRLQNIHRVLTKGGSLELPKDMREELLETWKSLENAIKPRLSHKKPDDASKKLSTKLNELKRIMDGIQLITSQKEVSGLSEPLRLRNIGNSCYLDSVLQALAPLDVFFKDLSRPLRRDDYLDKLDLFEKKSAIRKELLQFLEERRMNRGAEFSKIGFALFLMEDGPSQYRLRQAIFKSGLKSDFSMITLEEQHDAAILMELLIENFLPNCRLKRQEYTSTDDLPGLEFEHPVDDMLTLQIPLRPEKYQSLSWLIKWVMHRRIERASRLYDPKDGKIVDEKTGAASQAAAPQNVEKYVQWYRFKELPEALVLNFKRTIFTEALTKKKDERPVDLPDDGIVDLSMFYDAPKDGPKQAKYEIRSYVSHDGSDVELGHYVAYVKIKGKYFSCNDLDANGFKEITKKEFYGRQDAYMIVLERLPEEKAPEEPKANEAG